MRDVHRVSVVWQLDEHILKQSSRDRKCFVTASDACPFDQNQGRGKYQWIFQHALCAHAIVALFPGNTGSHLTCAFLKQHAGGQPSAKETGGSCLALWLYFQGPWRVRVPRALWCVGRWLAGTRLLPVRGWTGTMAPSWLWISAWAHPAISPQEVSHLPRFLSFNRFFFKCKRLWALFLFLRDSASFRGPWRLWKNTTVQRSSFGNRVLVSSLQLHLGIEARTICKMLVDQNTGQCSRNSWCYLSLIYTLLKEGDEKYYWTKPGPDALLSKPASAAAVHMSQNALRSAPRIILGQFKACVDKPLPLFSSLLTLEHFSIT